MGKEMTGKEKHWNNNKNINNSIQKITLQLQVQNTSCWLIIQVESLSNSEKEKRNAFTIKILKDN